LLYSAITELKDHKSKEKERKKEKEEGGAKDTLRKRGYAKECIVYLTSRLFEASG
jgi:hypothetical protein